MVNIAFQTEESAGQLKESGSYINVPPRINDHVSPCEVIRGKNPRQKTWKMICQETIQRQLYRACHFAYKKNPGWEWWSTKISKQEEEVGITEWKGNNRFIGEGCFIAPPIPISLLCWNCHRLGNPEIEQGLGDLIQAQYRSVVFLAETWLTKARLEEIRACYKFGGMIEVSRETRGGGVVVFWKTDFDFSMDKFSPNHIDAIVNKGKDDAWTFTSFYGELDTRNHHISWAKLRSLKARHSLPWIRAGNLNEITRAHEKLGGRLRPFR